MRKPNDVHISDAIKLYLARGPLGQKFLETGVIIQWPQIVGAPVANRTSKIYISRAKLFVKVDSDVIRNDLFYFKDKIVAEVNRRAGKILITEVVLL